MKREDHDEASAFTSSVGLPAGDGARMFEGIVPADIDHSPLVSYDEDEPINIEDEGEWNDEDPLDNSPFVTCFIRSCHLESTSEQLSA